MIETTKLLINYAMYHEWVINEILLVLEKTPSLNEEILVSLNHELDIHNYWLSVIQENNVENRTPCNSIGEIISVYNDYHERWKRFIVSLSNQDLFRLVKFTNKNGLIKTHTIIDLLIEAFLNIEHLQRTIAQQLESKYSKKVKLGFLDYRQRLNSL